jgi:hypothetical protein
MATPSCAVATSAATSTPSGVTALASIQSAKMLPVV